MIRTLFRKNLFSALLNIAVLLCAAMIAATPCAMAQEPPYLSAQADQAEELLDLGRAQEALDQLDSLGELGRNYYRVPLLRCRALIDLGRYDDALDEAVRAGVLEPGDGDVLFWHAVALVHLGRTSEALPMLDRVVRADPHFAPAYFYRGVVFQAEGRDEFAATDFQNAVAYAKPGQEWIAAQVENVQRGLGLPGAEGNSGVQLNRRGPRTMERTRPELAAPCKDDDYNRRLADLYATGDLDAAIDLTNEQLGLYPDDATLSFNLAALLHMQDRLENALEFYEYADSLDPDNAELLTAWGSCLEEAGDEQAGIEKYKAAIQASPMLATARINLGNAYVDMGEYADAIEVFEDALDQDPNYMLFYYGLMTALVGRNMMQEAADILEQRFGADPIDVAALPETDYVDYSLVTLVTADPTGNFNFAHMLADYGFLTDAATFFHLFVQTYSGKFPEAETAARDFLKQYPAPVPE